MTESDDPYDWKADQQAWFEAMAARYAFLAEFPDLDSIADILERDARARARRELDDWLDEGQS